MHKARNESRPQRRFKDPVCGMEVSPATAPDACEYRGKVYYFCAPVCRETFENDPQSYLEQQSR